LQLFQRVEALTLAGAQGGSTSELHNAGALLATANAELAWADKDVLRAVRHLAVAVKQARSCVAAAETRHNAGQVTAEILSLAIVRRADAELALIRGLMIAKAGNVDVSGIELPEPQPTETDVSIDKQQFGDSYYHPGSFKPIPAVPQREEYPPLPPGMLQSLPSSTK
jgi:hypothetical protein